MSQHVKAILEYQADFWISMVAAMMTQLLGIIFLWVIFERIPSINGWTYWEIAFMYGLVFLSEGISSFFFNGIWVINNLINRGEMDRLLVRPLPTLLQVMTSHFGMNGLGNILIGSIIVIQAAWHVDIRWTWWQLLLAVIFALSGGAIRVAINLVSNSISFWTQGPRNSFPFMIHSISDFTKYPITIYAMGIQLFISIVVPYAFISFYPAAYLFGKEGWSSLGLLTPIVAGIALFISIRVFYRGLKRYESAGN
jgi:ABC-2 type transport system permease protein